MWSDEARQAAAAARGGSAKAAPYHAAVAGFSAAAGKWAQGIINAQADLAAHQTGTLDNLKTTDQMMAEHDRIWGRK